MPAAPAICIPCYAQLCQLIHLQSSQGSDLEPNMFYSLFSKQPSKARLTIHSHNVSGLSPLAPWCPKTLYQKWQISSWCLNPDLKEHETNQLFFFFNFQISSHFPHSDTLWFCKIKKTFLDVKIRRQFLLSRCSLVGFDSEKRHFLCLALHHSQMFSIFENVFLSYSVYQNCEKSISCFSFLE